MDVLVRLRDLIIHRVHGRLRVDCGNALSRSCAIDRHSHVRLWVGARERDLVIGFRPLIGPSDDAARHLGQLRKSCSIAEDVLVGSRSKGSVIG